MDGSTKRNENAMAPEEVADDRYLRVLVGEDEVLQRERLSRLISGWGHNAVLARDGKKVLERTRSERFDLFILEVFLPDMTALELIPQI